MTRFLRSSCALTALLVALAGSAQADIITGLQNYYDFNASAAPVLDGSGNNRDGVITGNVTWVNDAVRGGALEFDSENIVVRAAAPTLSASGFTVSLWALRSPSATSGNRGLFVLNNGSSGSTQAKTLAGWVNDSDQVWGRISTTLPTPDNRDLPKSSSATTPDNLWTQLTFRGTGSEYQVFQNGVYTGNSVDYSGEFLGVIDTLSIGHQGSESWRGRLDDVRVYDRALSDGDIAQLYADTLAPARYAAFDVNSGASPTQAGFIPITPATSVPNPTDSPSAVGPSSASDVTNGITLTMSASLNEHRDRVNNPGGHPLTSAHPQYNLLRDFAFENDGQPVQLDLTGLEPFSAYSLRIYSFDWQANNGAVSHWYQDTVGGTPLYTHTNDSDNPGSGYFDLLLWANAQGGIRLLATAPNLVIFNGLEITQVPEPSSLMLAGLGLALAVTFRRRASQK